MNTTFYTSSFTFYLLRLVKSFRAIKFILALLFTLLCVFVASAQTAANLALNQPATASSVGTDALDKIIHGNDGNSNTYWHGTLNTMGSFAVDLGADYTLNTIRINHSRIRRATRFTVDLRTSSGNWINGTEIATTGDIMNIPVSGKYRHVRVTILASASSWWMTGASLDELEVFGYPDAPVASNVSGCGSVTLSASGAPEGGTYQWYNAAGTAIGTGATFTPPLQAGSTDYFVSIKRTVGGVSSNTTESAKTKVTATVSSPPSLSQDVTNGQTASYSFAGNINDVSGNGNNLGISGTSSFISDRNGVVSSAFNFDGSNYLATYNNTAVAAPQTFSISLWFNTTTAGGKLIGYGSSQTGISNSKDRQLYMSNTGQLYFGVYPNAVKTVSTTSGGYNDGKWHHVVASLSATGMKLYVDGVLQGHDATTTSGQVYNGYWRIGYDDLSGWPGATANYYYKGSLDDVQIYNRELTTSEIYSMRGAGTDAICAGNTLNLKANTVAGATYTWTGPNGFTSNAQNPVITNASTAHSGNYTVNVTVNGCTSQMNVKATVNPAAKPDFSIISGLVYAGNQAAINYTGSLESGNTYTWDFAGGEVVTGILTGTSYVKWNTPGVKVIKVTVTNASGCAMVVTKEFRIQGNYTWKGIIGSSWANPANWDHGWVPNEYDDITIKTGSNLPTLNASVTIRNFIMESGNLNLSNGAIIAKGRAEFKGGLVNGVINITAPEIAFQGATFNSTVTASSDDVYLDGAVFQNGATITKSGGSDNISAGGNVFNGLVTIVNNTNSRLVLGNTIADAFKGNVIFKNQGNGTLEISNNSNSTFAGNITIDSNSPVTFGRAILDGVNNQQIAKVGNANIVFKNLTVNKAAGAVKLNTPVNITTNLNLVKQNIESTLANLVVFNAGATITGASNSSFVEGPVRRYGAGSFTFPVGKAGKYRPVSINPAGVASDAFTAEYFPENADAQFSLSSRTSDLKTISSCEFWEVERTYGNTPSTVTLSWDNSVDCDVVSPADLLVAHWDGGKWESYGNSGTTGTAEAGTVTTSMAAASFSPFTLGSRSTINPLPVELISFRAAAQKGSVKLNWSTATELNNEGFWVQRSDDGRSFTDLAFVTGGNTTNRTINYSYTDRTAKSGQVYYRLRQVDHDGTEELSKVVDVYLQQETVLTLVAAPNPVADKVKLSWTSENSQPWQVQITDAKGRKVYATVVKAESGTGALTVDMHNYASGLYLITLSQANGQVYRHKLIKQ